MFQEQSWLRSSTLLHFSPDFSIPIWYKYLPKNNTSNAFLVQKVYQLYSVRFENLLTWVCEWPEDKRYFCIMVTISFRNTAWIYMYQAIKNICFVRLRLPCRLLTSSSFENKQNRTKQNVTLQLNTVFSWYINDLSNQHPLSAVSDIIQTCSQWLGCTESVMPQLLLITSLWNYLWIHVENWQDPSHKTEPVTQFIYLQGSCCGPIFNDEPFFSWTIQWHCSLFFLIYNFNENDYALWHH